MRSFGMENETELASAMSAAATKIPLLMMMPSAVSRYARDGTPLNATGLADEWTELLPKVEALGQQGKIRLTVGKETRTFKSLTEIIRAMRKIGDAKQRASLEWVARVTMRSVPYMHDR